MLQLVEIDCRVGVDFFDSREEDEPGLFFGLGEVRLARGHVGQILGLAEGQVGKISALVGVDLGILPHVT